MTSTRRVALVTGGRRGIGFGVAKCLARDGFNLAIAGVASAADSVDAVNELQAFGVEVQYCQADISSSADRQRMVDEIKARFGRLDVLVNNAGVAPRVRMDILEATEESFERLIKTNLQGPYFLTQLVARWMIEQRKATPQLPMCIVNVSSISAAVASPSRGEYCISKAGLSMATALWATRLGEFDIPVFEVRPGIIQTDMTSGVKDKYDKLISEGLLLQSRWGQGQDVGKVVAAMARGDLGYSTGQVIYVDGGFHVQRL